MVWMVKKQQIDKIAIGVWSTTMMNFLLKGNIILGMHMFLYTSQCFSQ